MYNIHKKAYGEICRMFPQFPHAHKKMFFRMFPALFQTFSEISACIRIYAIFAYFCIHSIISRKHTTPVIATKFLQNAVTFLLKPLPTVTSKTFAHHCRSIFVSRAALVAFFSSPRSPTRRVLLLRLIAAERVAENNKTLNCFDTRLSAHPLWV